MPSLAGYLPPSSSEARYSICERSSATVCPWAVEQANTRAMNRSLCIFSPIVEEGERKDQGHYDDSDKPNKALTEKRGGTSEALFHGFDEPTKSFKAVVNEVVANVF
jgi:hypothetical protein